MGPPLIAAPDPAANPTAAAAITQAVGAEVAEYDETEDDPLASADPLADDDGFVEVTRLRNRRARHAEQVRLAQRDIESHDAVVMDFVNAVCEHMRTEYPETFRSTKFKVCQVTSKASPRLKLKGGYDWDS